MTEAKFITENGKLYWVETTKSEVTDFGCIYLCREKHAPGPNKHLIYKLIQSYDNDKFFWSPLWNTSKVLGNQYLSIRDAIIYALLKELLVIQTTFDKLISNKFEFDS